MNPTPLASSTRRRSTSKRAVLLICCLSLLLVALDNTIVNVALPSIRRDFNASVQSLQWIVGGYVLVIGSLLLLAGTLADRFGRKRMFVIGLTIFTCGSLLCGFAPNEDALIALRMLQGVGGATMTPVALAIISHTYTDPAEKAKAIGWWGAVSGIGIAAGPLLGGFLVDALGWRSIFFINVPLGVLTVLFAIRFIPESRADSPRRFDLLGQLLAILLLTCAAVAIIETPTEGWSVVTGGATTGAVLTLVVFILWERQHPAPLIDLTLFGDGPFRRAFITALIAFFGFSGLLFASTIYLQDVRGVTPSVAGLLTLPLAFVVILAGPVAGRMVGSGHTRTALIWGGAAMAAGGLLLAPVSLLPVWVIVVPFLLFGAGWGLLNDPVNVTAVSELPDAQSGLAASLISAAKQVGQLLGVSVVGAVVALAPAGATAAEFAPVAVLIAAILVACGVWISVMNGRRTREVTRSVQ